MACLVFTKGAALFEATFYRTAVEEIRAYAHALLAAEKREPGFGWKFAAYMRDPERGKGNRIQGSVAPAILAAAEPDGPFTEEYVFRCLRHRPDDVTHFVAHGKNLGLPPPSDAAKRGMARALATFDDYQILKYARKDVALAARRKTKNGTSARRTLRLVDAMGLCKAHLDERLTKLYAWLHAPTRARAPHEAGTPILEARRRFFHGSNDAYDFATARLTHEQARSFLGNHIETWRRLFDVKGLVGDLAFMKNVRSMHLAGVGVEALVAEVAKRRFDGVWPHQVYAGARAVRAPAVAMRKYKQIAAFERPGTPALGPVFDAMMGRIVRALLPATPSLGLADLSGSMFCVPLGGAKSTLKVGDVAGLFSALMAEQLGYCGSFGDDVNLVEREGRTPIELANALLFHRVGMGSTQVAGAVRHLLAILLADPKRPRPRTLFFFSDMQFAPPAAQRFAGQVTDEVKQAIARLPPLDPSAPPLLAVLGLWREQLGPVDVVLWNLASYDDAPMPSGMDHVLMLSGFDANSFDHVKTWQELGSRGRTPVAPKPPIGARPPKKDDRVELDVIRGF